MKSFSFKLDIFWTIIIIVVIIIAVFLFIGSKKGWFDKKLGDLDLKEEGGNVDNNTAKYRHLASAIRDSLYGVNASDEGMEQAYNLIMPLNDNELRMVVNEYNRLYAGEDYYKTIRSLVTGEWVSCGEWYYFFYESDACVWRREILNRLGQVGA